MAQKKEFDLTSEEVHKLEQALKQEEFRKLLVDYAKEIRDPENKKKYEEEIALLERERGQDVKFLSSNPGFVVKTKSIDSDDKVFINVCQSPIVAKATATPVKRSKRKGDSWSIPYSLTTIRKDVDHANAKCSVIDFVIHPETYALGQKDARFKKMLVDTAFDGIEQKRGLKLDKEVVKYLKMSYKGTPAQSIIRKPLDDKGASAAGQQKNKLPFAVPYPPLNTEEASPDTAAGDDDVTADNKAPATPKYVITYRGGVELQDYTTDSSFVRSTRPYQLVVTIDLPGLESANDVELDYDSSSLDLYCPTPPYRLQLKLPYKVNEDQGSAKFEKAKQRLVVTLSVLPMETTFVNSELKNDCKISDAQTETEEAPQQDATTTEACAKNQEDCKSVESHDPEVHNNHTEGLVSMASHEPWKCPTYTYHQTDDDVTFILHVPVVKATTLVKCFEPQQIIITFTTNEATQYSFAVLFPDGRSLDVTRCCVDVSQENVVVMAVKSDECRTTWQHFQVGRNLVDMEEKQFLTEENVIEQCAMIGSHTHKAAGSGVELQQVSVTEFSSDVLTISVDQPEPPASNEPHPPSPPVSNEPHPSSPPCSDPINSPPSCQPSKSPDQHHSTYSQEYIEEPANNQQPLPQHELTCEPRPNATSNSEPHPPIDHNDENRNASINLVPSNQLLFELD